MSGFDYDLFVIGAMGPTGKLPSSNDPVLSAVTFDELSAAYAQQAAALACFHLSDNS